MIHASHEAPTAYFRAKAEVEDALVASGLSHAIVRPTVTYGPGDILVNNLAWTLRRLPVFGVPGDGRYPAAAERSCNHAISWRKELTDQLGIQAVPHDRPRKLSVPEAAFGPSVGQSESEVIAVVGERVRYVSVVGEVVNR